MEGVGWGGSPYGKRLPLFLALDKLPEACIISIAEGFRDLGPRALAVFRRLAGMSTPAYQRCGSLGK